MAGFVDGELVFVLEVPFESLYETLKAQLDRKFGGERPKGIFLRSANFSFRDYADDKRVRCLFLHPQWRNFANFLNRNFFAFLKRFEGRCSKCKWS